MHELTSEVHATYNHLREAWVQQMQAYRRSLRVYRESELRRQARRRHADVPRGTAVHLTGRAPVQPPARLPERATERSVDTSSVRGSLRLVSAADAVPVMRACPLTRRQIEVVELVAQGMTNGQIAERLVLTPGTVANHVENILRRLGVRNRAAAVAWASREGVIGGRDSLTDTSASTGAG